MRYYVLGRVSDASHRPWICVAIEDDFTAAFDTSNKLDTKPGCESSIVEESALTNRERSTYRNQLEQRKAVPA